MGGGINMKRRVLLLLKRSMLDGYVSRERMQMCEPPFASLMVSHPKRFQTSPLKSKRRLVLKSYFLDPTHITSSRSKNFELAVGNLSDRHRVHQHTVEVCKDVLKRKSNVVWDSLMRDELRGCPIRDVDLVVTIGGDGTLLQASHCLDSSIPVVGVNSDPTRATIEASVADTQRHFLLVKVEENLEEFDATRSTGYLCAANADNFEQVLDEILDGSRKPLVLNRILTRIDGMNFTYPSLNDVLLSHPNPAAVSRCSFSIRKAGNDEPTTSVVHSRSSGLRICSAAGSTAAMASAGGEIMDFMSPDLQYMIREPIRPHPLFRDHLRGWIRPDEVLNVQWGCRQGVLHFDGSHVFQQVKFGSVIEFSSNAPPLKIFTNFSKNVQM
ncbi:hypothetical protein AXG93_725s1030 [Marchantia polymorpha subsp. ruderalis]|uniref:NADH kinase n=1 Tax=Marchantia polymorpha subsp. ruderalis TaxID=1480154 RepID=A0A176WES1_MARPO|nr:hypothetical protein AXG93_725s1030 [Marchantia polymorpha subsp. ruderalis]